MKKIFLSLFGIMMILTTGCKDDNPTAFSFSHDYAEFTIPVTSTSIQGDIDLGTFEFETDIQSLVADNGVSIDNLDAVKIKGVTLTINDTNSSPYTFDLLARVNAEIGNLNNANLIEFAKKDPVPSGALNSIDLDVSDIDLLPYFKQTKFKFKLSGFTNGPIDHDFDVKVALKVQMEGEVIK